MDTPVRHDFNQSLRDHACFPLKRAVLSELQINLGYLCNQACEHCHVEAGPKRTEMMALDTMDRIVQWAKENQIKAVDLTGGAPEMIPHFRYFVDQLIALGIRITSRCNITVLFEPGQEDLAEWYAERKVRLVCSLPCYSEINVDKQRGKGVFGKSISGLQQLNKLGYGREPGLQIDLVYNPIGPVLPPAQHTLEQDYKARLKKDFDIDFNHLLTITNLPINRFEHYLHRTGQLEGYMQLLADSFNPDTVDPLMCRHLVSVDWQGYVYDCDFNQMLSLPFGHHGRKQLWEINGRELEGDQVTVGKHCYGCTAGAGSSCGGSLT
ncbi:MAG: arsenosugar biosynthesis radical SAM protein ArsS [Acidiferrobacterales bacterium]|nr:arsenosugar biosynthesis radical SAM protein ArsS [Acidiferrobacterales bacterium]